MTDLNQIHNKPAHESVEHDEREIHREMLYAEHDFKRAEICYLRRGTGYHKRGRAAHAHAAREPLLQKRDRSAAAGVERHAYRRRHK